MFKAAKRESPSAWGNVSLEGSTMSLLCVNQPLAEAEV